MCKGHDTPSVLQISNRKFSKYAQFWVHPVLKRKQQQGEFDGLIQELKLPSCIFHDVSGAVYLGQHLRRQRDYFRESMEPEQPLTESYSTIQVNSMF